MRIRTSRTLLIIACAAATRSAFAQPCVIDFTLTANPPPVGGQYGPGQNVEFCFTVNNFDNTANTNFNWLHGVVPTLGAGWDVFTFVPGAPPPDCSGAGGSWLFLPSVTGTGPNSVGTVGPGWFYDDIFADGDPGNNLGDECTGPWTFCFTISVLNGAGCIDGADLTVNFDTFGDSETGSYTDAGCGGDVIASAAATALCCTANAGTDGFVSLCFSDPLTDLFPFLGNFPDAGGTWTDPFGLPVAQPIDPALSAPGDYTYTANLAGCAPDQSIVSVDISFGANAGTDAFTAICATGPVTDLFPFLGAADAGGSWTNPFGGFSSGFFDPTFDSPGDYTYTVLGQGNCPGDQAFVTVNVIPAPNPGISNALDLCSTGGVVDLFPVLAGADPGGTWSDPNNNFSSGFMDPLFDPAGTYTYSVFGVAPCTFATATVDVTVNTPPQTGNIVPTTVCSGDAPVDLFPLFNGFADLGGTWSDPNGGPFNGILDPGTDVSGSYVYTVTGIAPCPDGVNSVDVTILPSPNAGNPGGATICALGDPVDLFLSILGTPDVGGTWTDPNGIASTGIVNPVNAVPGIYTYSVPASAQCAGDFTTVELVVVQPPNAGIDNSVAACENEPNIFLDGLLGGSQDVNGSWTTPGGGASNGIVDPTLLDAGDYTYTVQAIAPCPDDVAIVTVTIDTLPSPGEDAEVAICANLDSLDLFPLVGVADTVGTWTAPDGSPFSGIFDPATNPTGDYTYTVVGEGACAGVIFSSIVTATSQNLPSPVFTQDTIQGCVDLTIAFALPDSTITLSQWDFGDGATADGILDAGHTYEDLGFFNVSVIVLDDNGCTDTLAVDSAVLVHDLPNPFFITQPNPAGTLTPDVAFTTAVSDYPSYVWTAGGDSVGSGIPFGLHFPFFEARTTEICLVVTDTNGCENEHCEDVVIDQDLAVYVPNAFSPNGNGINEVFYPVILGAETKDFEFTIFDRWGELVFRTEDMTEPWKGGMNNADTPLEPGVFTWRVRLRESAKAEREDIYGHVTLLK